MPHISYNPVSNLININQHIQVLQNMWDKMNYWWKFLFTSESKPDLLILKFYCTEEIQLFFLFSVVCFSMIAGVFSIWVFTVFLLDFFKLSGLEKVSLIVEQRLKLCIKSPSGEICFQSWCKVNQQLDPCWHVWCPPRTGDIQDLHCWLASGVDMCSWIRIYGSKFDSGLSLCIKHHLWVMSLRMFSLTVRHLYVRTHQGGDLELCIYPAASVRGLQPCDDAISQALLILIIVWNKKTATEKRLGTPTLRVISIKKIHSQRVLVREKTDKVIITATNL